jgi:predicted ATP-grasp superfamily ATP-dependent carboligase
MNRRPVRVLVIEELTACSDTWPGAAETMKEEAAAMVIAVLQDLAQIAGCQPLVLLCVESATQLIRDGKLPASSEVQQNHGSTCQWMSAAGVFAESVDYVLLIAPESDGILVQRLAQLAEPPWAHVCVLNCDGKLAELFADKHLTALWLQEHGLPGIPSFVADDHGYATVISTKRAAAAKAGASDSGQASTLGLSNSVVVIKPRDGAGCDRITICDGEFSELLDASRRDAFADGMWLVQPFVDGTFLSAAMIGRGEEAPPLVLPAGEQIIQAGTKTPVYCGGRIPAAAEIVAAVNSILQQIAECLPVFRGWLGVDLVATRSFSGEMTIRVVELNPRLCTSYVGYRRAVGISVADWIPNLATRTRFHADLNSTAFLANGDEVRVQGGESETGTADC